MSAFPYLVLLFCLVGLGIHVSEAAPPTPNPECPGLHRIAKSLEKGLKAYTKETTLCRVNNACTGLMCNGTHKQNDFYMKMELKHCKTPPSIKLHLIYKDIKVDKEMTQGHPIEISKKKVLGVQVPIDLKLTLKKNRNKITTGLKVELCPSPKICTILFTLLRPTTFCLNMKTCPGYNSTGDVPCPVNPTGNPTAMSTMTGTSFPGTASRPRTYPSTHHSGTTVQPGDTSALKRGSGHHHISTGLAVGIGFACLVAVLIIVAAAFYWKKFYRRSRLRAAYYNDISMNDPLYEDFGPEVA